MTNESGETSANDCARIQGLGYSTARHVFIYGKLFQIVSDPFPESGGVAVHAITAKGPERRTLQLPVSRSTSPPGIFCVARKP